MAFSKTGAAAALLLAALVPARPAAADGAYSEAGAMRYFSAKDWQGCVAYATAWSRAEPNNPGGWQYIGVCEGAGLDHPEQSIAGFKRFLELSPQEFRGWNAIGIEYAKAKRFPEAATALKRATELAPQKPNYWNNLAAVYTELKQWDQARQALETDFAEAAPHGTWHDWYVVGNGLANVLDYDKALTAYRHALEGNPQSGEIWNNMGVVAQAMGQNQQAFTDYQRAGALGNPLGTKNYAKLQQSIAAAQQQAAALARGLRNFNPMGGGGGGGGGDGGGSSSSCAYNTYQACNAAKSGNFWDADRLDQGTASGSTHDWYSE